MQPTSDPGYELCYLDARQSVPVTASSSNPHLDSGTSLQTASPDDRLSWWKSALAVGAVLVLVTLGIANVVLYARWHEVEDGVLWASRSEGITAVDVATGSAGDRAGIARGDVLLAVNGSPVETPADVLE